MFIRRIMQNIAEKKGKQRTLYIILTIMFLINMIIVIGFAVFLWLFVTM